ncbi:hypothetical protein WOLCODRAFT_136650 [Wolfiporia cocos MD-104 SS10]|uniref:Uncharacterized protein n=1 Tax=Wolfiporia cocos (strain MD-104) TaxID=742152 RepID=A0A2H3JTQ9_WOLCO|nr:hypothetical protein WOLCODRAFT_136650 [Wolfiporia cocos MD-104 SS10]
MTEKVLDILLSSGAHLSRYLAQCAIHHYFRTQVPFIKSPWVRTMSLPVFTHFMTLAARLYGDIPVGKGDDDGTIFTLLLKTSRFPAARSVKWETMKEVLEKYKFIPFSNKDPMMAQFPLVLAIEPRLLPYARVNGFYMDGKYRNFVFRKMFEKPAVASDGHADEIVQNVRELSRLDSHMFLSRTVAAEICMEARTNEPAYTALKRLNKEGLLKFDLGLVVKELIALFLNTRSICNTYTYSVLRELYVDFPSQEPTVRTVLLCTIFFSEGFPVPPSLAATTLSSSALTVYVNACKDKIEGMGLCPVTRTDLFNVLVNKFTPDRFGGIIEYGRVVAGLGRKDIDGLLHDVAIACLEVGCKGKMLKKLVETDETLSDVLAAHIIRNFRLDLDDLPLSEDVKACEEYQARLCRNFASSAWPGISSNIGAELRGAVAGAVDAPQEDGPSNTVHNGTATDVDSDDEPMASREITSEADIEDLGPIGQDTLTTMIRKDELAPTRRRRFYELYTAYTDSFGKLTYPADYMQVGRWIRNQYGRRSAVTAIFMLHAVINENTIVLQSSMYPDPFDHSSRIPITLKHFKLLARLGRAPDQVLFDDIESGIEFYFGEEDYLSPEELNGHVPSKTRNRRFRVKTEHTRPDTPPEPRILLSELPATEMRESIRGKKRPRRSAASSVKSYTVPDSDDEDIAEGTSDEHVKKRRSETNLQRWVKHLSALLREEQKKYNEKKRREQAAAEPNNKIRVNKTAFHRSLATNLSRLRKIERQRRQQLYGVDAPSDNYSEGEEDEYQYRTTRSKRRKATH